MIVTARWVLPIDQRPIAHGWVEILGNIVVGVGGGRPPGPAHDLGQVAVLPGLVNAHTHIELSWLAGRVPPAGSMDEWIRSLMAVRRHPPVDAERDRSSEAAIRSMLASGTALVGDVSNTLSTVRTLSEAGLAAVVFHELLGFNALEPVRMVAEADDRVQRALAAFPSEGAPRQPAITATVVAHAPYSVSPALFSEIARRPSTVPSCVHLGESAEETEFLRTGQGPMRRLLEDLGVWTDAWTVPRCDPVEFLHRVGYLQPGLLAVHAVHLDRDALERLRDVGAVVVTCPRSNSWVGSALPRVAAMYDIGVPVAIGTDSLASNATLNLFDELAEIRRIAPDVDAAAILESATRVGAEALGRGRTHGTIASGKSATLAVVAVPDDVGDVEEYLVSGVPAGSVRLLT